MEQLSLTTLQGYIKQVLSVNFDESLWVSCELGQIKSSRGHVYLDLIDKNEVTNRIEAKAQAVIWASTYQQILSKIGSDIYNVLKEGVQVLLMVKVDFHAQYGLKLTIQDVDITYTLGSLAKQRAETVQKLKEEELLELNKSVKLPLVPKRIAVISSATAAGLQDFQQQLLNNAFGYAYEVKLFPAAMQGGRVVPEVVGRLQEISSVTKPWDMVCILRGGGSKLDLVDFDEYELCASIAQMSIPVMTGIGHDIDESIADMVAAIAVKTPTAAATWIIDRSIAYESSVNELEVYLQALIQQQIESQKRLVDQLSSELERATQVVLSTASYELTRLEDSLKSAGMLALKHSEHELERLSLQLKLVQPTDILSRGFALVGNNEGEIIKSVKGLAEGEDLKIQLLDGAVTASVKTINYGEEVN